jgi:hypothetical protein
MTKLVVGLMSAISRAIGAFFWDARVGYLAAVGLEGMPGFFGERIPQASKSWTAAGSLRTRPPKKARCPRGTPENLMVMFDHCFPVEKTEHMLWSPQFLDTPQRVFCSLSHLKPVFLCR